MGGNDTHKYGPRIVVALDYPSAAPAIAMAERLDPGRCRVKVGEELFTAAGPSILEQLHRFGFDIFLDLKLYDIPNTVAAACRAAAAHGIWMVNVHASGGRRMMEAARDAVRGPNDRPLVIAVTVLTSLDYNDLAETGIRIPLIDQVCILARLAAECRLDGMVCSAADLGQLHGVVDADFARVTPGIRLAHIDDDQRRVMLPGEAVRAGARYLVVGRPITTAPDPYAALTAIECDIAACSGG